ncbi:hypothetical protein AI2884V1_3657 [Serratia marcescens]|nr:hypothetical protein AI2872V1_3657 [Serratia marcescens]CAF2690367.1 hypothetical protein AI2884V1_3657 [Serratia marcescens]CAH5385024.1 hypothetical protein AI2872V1_3657 [Serratia marcescens]CAH5419266.1 hypothetical protein AI2884V1_3657 [Serratia marcescens]
MKKRFSDEQIISILREAEQHCLHPIVHLCFVIISDYLVNTPLEL